MRRELVCQYFEDWLRKNSSYLDPFKIMDKGL